jgi:hypothetical protein
MRETPSVRYVPVQFVDKLANATSGMPMDKGVLCSLYRLLEEAYAVGYVEGHVRGGLEQRILDEHATLTP